MLKKTFFHKQIFPIKFPKTPRVLQITQNPKKSNTPPLFPRWRPIPREVAPYVEQMRECSRARFESSTRSYRAYKNGAPRRDALIRIIFSCYSIAIDLDKRPTSGRLRPAACELSNHSWRGLRAIRHSVSAMPLP